MSAPEYDETALRAMIEKGAKRQKLGKDGWLWIELPVGSYHIGAALIDELRARGIGLRGQGDGAIVYCGGGQRPSA